MNDLQRTREQMGLRKLANQFLAQVQSTGVNRVLVTSVEKGDGKGRFMAELAGELERVNYPFIPVSLSNLNLLNPAPQVQKLVVVYGPAYLQENGLLSIPEQWMRAFDAVVVLVMMRRTQSKELKQLVEWIRGYGIHNIWPVVNEMEAPSASQMWANFKAKLKGKKPAPKQPVWEQFVKRYPLLSPVVSAYQLPPASASEHVQVPSNAPPAAQTGAAIPNAGGIPSQQPAYVAQQHAVVPPTEVHGVSPSQVIPMQPTVIENPVAPGVAGTPVPMQNGAIPQEVQLDQGKTIYSSAPPSAQKVVRSETVIRYSSTPPPAEPQNALSGKETLRSSPPPAAPANVQVFDGKKTTLRYASMPASPQKPATQQNAPSARLSSAAPPPQQNGSGFDGTRTVIRYSSAPPAPENKPEQAPATRYSYTPASPKDADPNANLTRYSVTPSEPKKKTLPRTLTIRSSAPPPVQPTPEKKKEQPVEFGTPSAISELTSQAPNAPSHHTPWPAEMNGMVPDEEKAKMFESLKESEADSVSLPSPGPDQTPSPPRAVSPAGGNGAASLSSVSGRRARTIRTSWIAPKKPSSTPPPPSPIRKRSNGKP